MSKEKLEFPFIGVMPYAVMADKSLPANAKIHYACLAGLAKKEGYCWATDMQLAEMHGVEVRQVQRWHEALEKKSFISRHTKNRPHQGADDKVRWKKERKIFVVGGFSTPKSDSDKNDASYDSDKNDVFYDTGKNDALSSKSLSINLKERKTSETPPASRSPSPAAREVSNHLHSYLKKRNSNMKIKSPTAWLANAEKIVKQYPDVAQVKTILDWVFTAESSEAEFWRRTIQAPASLYRNIDSVVSQMNDRPKAEKAAEAKKKKIELAKVNKTWVNRYLKGVEFADHNQAMYIRDHVIEIRQGNECFPLAYTTVRFKEIIQNKIKTWERK